MPRSSGPRRPRPRCGSASTRGTRRTSPGESGSKATARPRAASARKNGSHPQRPATSPCPTRTGAPSRTAGERRCRPAKWMISPAVDGGGHGAPPRRVAHAARPAASPRAGLRAVPRMRYSRSVTLGQGFLVTAAAAAAGLVNAVAGGGTLLTFPSLLARRAARRCRQRDEHGRAVARPVSSVWAYRQHIDDERRRALVARRSPPSSAGPSARCCCWPCRRRPSRRWSPGSSCSRARCSRCRGHPQAGGAPRGREPPGGALGDPAPHLDLRRLLRRGDRDPDARGDGHPAALQHAARERAQGALRAAQQRRAAAALRALGEGRLPRWPR